jgi:hypothetical protein
MSIRLNDVVQITVNAVQAGQRITNVLHYVPIGTVDPMLTSLGAFLTAFRTLWRDSMLPVQTTTLFVQEYVGVVIRGTVAAPGGDGGKVLDLGDIVTLVGDVVDDSGTAIGDTLPTNIAISYRKSTGQAGRTKRGGFRLGGALEAYTQAGSPNELTNAAITVLETPRLALEANLAGVGGEFLTPVVFSRTTLFSKPGPENNTTGTWTLIEQILLNGLVGTQQSRKQVRRLGA